MAWYKNPKMLEIADLPQFDDLHVPGTTVTWSGIYRCAGCGKEIVHTQDKHLPPQNHHQHTATHGAIRWQLIVTDSPKAES